MVRAGLALPQRPEDGNGTSTMHCEHLAFLLTPEVMVRCRCGAVCAWQDVLGMAALIR